MFTTASMTGTGIAVYFVAIGLKYLGIEGIENGQIAEFVTSAVQVGAFVLMVFGQLRRKDLVAGIIRR